ncbi:superoxide dismutase [Cu-Zn] SodC2 [Mixta theicola]|uniref:Superoxide dismutase [Cu-Zn] n=1 Tax=Mixta theicola TaxID=1458355 RepID=A0A2K1QDQ2_9GAMM|nr:superoxide dismutase family protein [Mixta theicola]PNS13152.1 superoxide dismutase [Cu-Zn] SodC2 [Mixta theicola]GLR09427.1 superoxide dismutase [Cu-Zn] [Mixta theicola]
MKYYGLAALTLLICGYAQAASEEVTLHRVTKEGIGASVGTVKIDETAYGLTFTPNLTQLPPGIHGFHVHANGSCEPATTEGKTVPAGAAGGHFDPQNSGKHLSPWGEGHLGDLPALYVSAEGTASNPVLAPRLKKISEISGKALMIHMGGDNHSDHPQPLGGGGARYACGVIK